MTAPMSQAVVETARAIGQYHRPASVSVERQSVTCQCGIESAERDGLELHRAELIAAAVVAAVQGPIKAEALRKAADEAEAMLDCQCGHSMDEHNGLGCYARLSYTPLTVCDCPLTDDRTHDELLTLNLRDRADEVAQP